MQTVEVPASEVRLSGTAVEALADERPVVVTRYGKRSHVVLTAEHFTLVEPFLELLVDGWTAPAELQMTEDDLELMQMLAEDREPSPGEIELIDELIAEL